MRVEPESPLVAAVNWCDNSKWSPMIHTNLYKAPVDLKSVGGVGVQYSMTFVFLDSVPLAFKLANTFERSH